MNITVGGNCFVPVLTLPSTESHIHLSPAAPGIGISFQLHPQDFSPLKHEQQNKTPRPIKLSSQSEVDFFPLSSILWDKKLLAEPVA